MKGTEETDETLGEAMEPDNFVATESAKETEEDKNNTMDTL